MKPMREMKCWPEIQLNDHPIMPQCITSHSQGYASIADEAIIITSTATSMTNDGKTHDNDYDDSNTNDDNEQPCKE